MGAMVFKSKVDLWLVAVVFGIPLVIIGIMIGAGVGTRDARPPLLAIPVVIVVYAFVAWIFRATDYRIDGATLVIRSAFLRWKIPIADIRTITPTHNPLSSPALSLDRLEIRHDGGDILVSPADKQGFIDSLRKVNPAIRVSFAN
jgi:PH (Pleckstrin Homology) domain-containing protein